MRLQLIWQLFLFYEHFRAAAAKHEPAHSKLQLGRLYGDRCTPSVSMKTKNEHIKIKKIVLGKWLCLTAEEWCSQHTENDQVEPFTKASPICILNTCSFQWFVSFHQQLPVHQVLQMLLLSPKLRVTQFCSFSFVVVVRLWELLIVLVVEAEVQHWFRRLCYYSVQ